MYVYYDMTVICITFQICHKGEKTKYKNAKDLLRHMPRLVKVTGTGKEFPSDVKQGDLIQILGEITEGDTTYLRWVDIFHNENEITLLTEVFNKYHARMPCKIKKRERNAYGEHHQCPFNKTTATAASEAAAKPPPTTIIIITTQQKTTKAKKTPQ